MRHLKVATRARPFSPNQDEVTRGRFAFHLKQPKVDKFYELIFEILDIIQLSFHDKWEANKVDPLAAWATAVRRLPSCVLGGGTRLAPSWEAGLGAGLREHQRAESQWGQNSGELKSSHSGGFFTHTWNYLYSSVSNVTFSLAVWGIFSSLLLVLNNLIKMV